MLVLRKEAFGDNAGFNTKIVVFGRHAAEFLSQGVVECTADRPDIGFLPVVHDDNLSVAVVGFQHERVGEIPLR